MKRGLVAVCMLLLMSLQMAGQEISGTVVDAKSKEPLIGATIEIEGGKPAGITDMDGRFKLTGLKEQKYMLIIRYVSYKAKTLRGILIGTTDLVVEMNADE